MAIIEFTGFVQEVKNEKKMTVSEGHRKKDNNGDYYTAARTYRTIKPGYDSGILFNDFKKDDMVKVTGREITETWTYEGKDYKDLVVQADSVEIAEPRAKQENSAPQQEDPWAKKTIPADLESPF